MPKRNHNLAQTPQIKPKVSPARSAQQMALLLRHGMAAMLAVLGIIVLDRGRTEMLRDGGRLVQPGVKLELAVLC